MTKRGPKPTPTATLKLRGSWRSRTRPGEPAVKTGGVVKPIWVKGRAKKVWREFAPPLIRAGVLTPIDRLAFGAYCQAAAAYLNAQELFEKAAAGDPVNGGLLITTSNGHLIHNPIFSVRNVTRDAMIKLGGEFGLTPASRTAIDVSAMSKPAAEKGPERFFNKPTG